ncbi:MAG: Spo0B domain-containing protein [Kyrpidia sp.]|nr:Spo0B domain-containing protein [Kyrpidia sp.]
MRARHAFILWAVWSVVWLGIDFGAHAVIGWGVASLASAVYLLCFARGRGMIHHEHGEIGDIGGVLTQRERAWIQALQHLRHHWMNECQLVRGYAQMRRWERVDEVVCRMAETAERQSGVTDFGRPNRSGVLLRLMCEFPWIRVAWDGPERGDLPGVAVAGIEEELRRAVGARMGRTEPCHTPPTADHVWVRFGLESDGGATIRVLSNEPVEPGRETEDRKGLHHVD